MLRRRIAGGCCALVAAASVTACTTLGLDPHLEAKSQARLDERLTFLKMSAADVGAIDAALDPGADSGMRTVPLSAGGHATLALSDPGWQDCRALNIDAAFTDQTGHPIVATLAGLLCPPEPITQLGHWHVARIAILSPEPPPPPPLPPVHHNNAGAVLNSTPSAKPATGPAGKPGPASTPASKPVTPAS